MVLAEGNKSWKSKIRDVFQVVCFSGVPGGFFCQTVFLFA